jgi:hypothetical protein
VSARTLLCDATMTSRCLILTLCLAVITLAAPTAEATTKKIVSKDYEPYWNSRVPKNTFKRSKGERQRITKAIKAIKDYQQRVNQRQHDAKLIKRVNDPNTSPEEALKIGLGAGHIFQIEKIPAHHGWPDSIVIDFGASKSSPAHREGFWKVGDKFENAGPLLNAALLRQYATNNKTQTKANNGKSIESSLSALVKIGTLKEGEKNELLRQLEAEKLQKGNPR